MSTFPAMPESLPLLVYCQNVHERHPPGTIGALAVV
jgi:hypothetical protein